VWSFREYKHFAKLKFMVPGKPGVGKKWDSRMDWCSREGGDMWLQERDNCLLVSLEEVEEGSDPEEEEEEGSDPELEMGGGGGIVAGGIR